MTFIKLFEQFIEESYLKGGRAPLYHSTRIFFAATILEEDQLRHPKRSFQGIASPKRISFTRDKNFVFEENPVTFVVDQEKLSVKHKIEPFDFFGQFEPGTRRSKGGEFEESVVGDIKELHKYLIAIRFEESMDFYATYNRSSREMYRESYADFIKALDEYVKKHPHVQVIDHNEKPIDIQAKMAKIDWETLEVI